MIYGARLYYHTDRLGSTTHVTDELCEVRASAIYDEWGNRSSVNRMDLHGRNFDLANSYTGHEWDSTLGVYYAKARFYQPSVGRFCGVDSVKGSIAEPLSLVQYSYCVGNPLRYIDPDGLARIVVSGGLHGGEQFEYGFIETAIKQIRLWQAESTERITWAIALHGYTAEDTRNFQTVANDLGVNLMLLSDKNDLFDYMNSGRNQDRDKHLITNMTFLAHGTELNRGIYAVALGMNLRGTHNNDLNIFVSDLSNINSSAFAQESLTAFYSCRTAQVFGGVNFAQEWANATGSTARAAVPRTSFYDIFPDERNILQRGISRMHGETNNGILLRLGLRPSLAQRQIERARFGFSPYGSRNMPTISGNASWQYFNALC